jgi:hypothetical protein
MKNLKIIILFGLISTTSSFGQFYVQPVVGYSFSSHPDEMKSIAIIDNQKSVYTMKIRFGESLNAGLTVGYCLWDHLFAEINSQMAIYGRHTGYIEPPDIQTATSFTISGYWGEIEFRGPVFRFAPRVGYMIQKDRFSAYFSLGPEFMKAKINETENTVVYRFYEEGIHSLDAFKKYEYYGGLHMGLQADLGITYAVRPELQLVMDIVTGYNNYEIKRGEITALTIDGTDQMDTLEDTSVYIYEGNDRVNHSYYGVNIGLRYVFGRRE